jgi:hypothetical protein
MRSKTIVRTGFALFSTLAAAAMLTFLCSLHTASLPAVEPVAMAEVPQQITYVDWTDDGRELTAVDDALAHARTGSELLEDTEHLLAIDVEDPTLSDLDGAANQPVPEPATAVLLGMGGVAVLVRRKRRKAGK